MIENHHVCCKIIAVCLPHPVQVASSRKKVFSFTVPSQLNISQNFPILLHENQDLPCGMAVLFPPSHTLIWSLQRSWRCLEMFPLLHDASSRLPSTGCDFAAHLVHVLDSPPLHGIKRSAKGQPMQGFRRFLSCCCNKSFTPTPSSGVLDMRRNPQGARKKHIH